MPPGKCWPGPSAERAARPRLKSWGRACACLPASPPNTSTLGPLCVPSAELEWETLSANTCAALAPGAPCHSCPGGRAEEMGQRQDRTMSTCVAF